VTTTENACSKCRKDWVTHHTLAGVSLEGKVSIHCHEEPVTAPDPVLKYVLGARAEKREAQRELEAFKKKASLDRQAAEAELGRKHASAVEAEAASKLEATRVQVASEFEAKIKDLQGQLRDAESISEQLGNELTDAKAKLAASQAKSIELQLEIDRLGEELRKERFHHDGLKHRSKDLVHLSMTLGKRVVVLERKLGTDGAGIDVDGAYRRLLEATPPPDIRSLEAIVLDEAAKAVPKGAPETRKPVATIVLDDEPPAAAPAPAEAAEDAHPVGNDEVIAEAASEDEESDDDGHEECMIEGCVRHATEALTFIKKDGDEARWTACDPSRHAKEFLTYLKQYAKQPPKSAADVIALFNPII
jgi:hypothetical protein